MGETGVTARDLTALFDPASVAVLGAPAIPAKWGFWLARSALEGAHRRKIYLVNRDGKEIFGQPTYRTLGDLPAPVDLVVIAIPAHRFLTGVDHALAAGAKAIVAITAGLGELGEKGRAVERAAVERVRAHGAVLVGPNCLGVADTTTQLNLASSDFGAGPIGLISQSGNLAIELALLASEAGLGFSRFVSIGNQADLGAAELIRAFTAHSETRLIALYLEDFRDGRDLAAAALEATEAGKPVVLLTAGSSLAGARAARSHTGALVSASVAIDAACRASGMLRVHTARGLVDLAQGLLMPDPVRGRRVGIAGDGGGHVALAADLVSDLRLDVPVLPDPVADQIAATLPAGAETHNPVDLAGAGEQDFFNFERVVRALASSGEVDSVLLTGYFGGYSQESWELAEREAQVSAAMAAAAYSAGCPLVVHTMYPGSPAIKVLRSNDVPVYSDIGSAVRVIERLAEREELPPAGVPRLPSSAGGVGFRPGYFEARRWLGDAGIEFVAARRVTSLTEARSAAAELGFPVVLKALASDHKSNQGAVRLGIPDLAELDAAFADLSSRLSPPEFSLERMAQVSEGIELIVGAMRDASFGPVVMVGLGGIYTELLADIAVALAPVSVVAAKRLILSLRGAPLLLGARGKRRLAIEDVAETVAALSRLAAKSIDIAEVEVNPLLVKADGVLGLDAHVVPVTSQVM